MSLCQQDIARISDLHVNKKCTWPPKTEWRALIEHDMCFQINPSKVEKRIDTTDSYLDKHTRTK